MKKYHDTSYSSVAARNATPAAREHGHSDTESFVTPYPRTDRASSSYRRDRNYESDAGHTSKSSRQPHPPKPIPNGASPPTNKTGASSYSYGTHTLRKDGNSSIIRQTETGHPRSRSEALPQWGSSSRSHAIRSPVAHPESGTETKGRYTSNLRDIFTTDAADLNVEKDRAKTWEQTWSRNTPDGRAFLNNWNSSASQRRDDSLGELEASVPQSIPRSMIPARGESSRTFQRDHHNRQTDLDNRHVRVDPSRASPPDYGADVDQVLYPRARRDAPLPRHKSSQVENRDHGVTPSWATYNAQGASSSRQYTETIRRADQVATVPSTSFHSELNTGVPAKYTAERPSRSVTQKTLSKHAGATARLALEENIVQQPQPSSSTMRQAPGMNRIPIHDQFYATTSPSAWQPLPASNRSTTPVSKSRQASAERKSKSSKRRDFDPEPHKSEDSQTATTTPLVTSTDNSLSFSRSHVHTSVPTSTSGHSRTHSHLAPSIRTPSPAPTKHEKSVSNYHRLPLHFVMPPIPPTSDTSYMSIPEVPTNLPVRDHPRIQDMFDNYAQGLAPSPLLVAPPTPHPSIPSQSELHGSPNMYGRSTPVRRDSFQTNPSQPQTEAEPPMPTQDHVRRSGSRDTMKHSSLPGRLNLQPIASASYDRSVHPPLPPKPNMSHSSGTHAEPSKEQSGVTQRALPSFAPGTWATSTPGFSSNLRVRAHPDLPQVTPAALSSPESEELRTPSSLNVSFSDRRERKISQSTVATQDEPSKKGGGIMGFFRSSKQSLTRKNSNASSIAIPATPGPSTSIPSSSRIHRRERVVPSQVKEKENDSYFVNSTPRPVRSNSITRMLQKSKPPKPGSPVRRPSGKKTPPTSVWSQLRLFSHRRHKTVSVASLEAQDGNTPLTIPDSPPSSIRRQSRPLPPLDPAIQTLIDHRDPIEATQAWRNGQEADLRVREKRGKPRTRRPGVTFDVPDDGSGKGGNGGDQPVRRSSLLRRMRL